jgi:hypothetical protein
MCIAIGALVFAVSLLPAARAGAQAWLPDKGVLSTSFVISDVLNKDHYTSSEAPPGTPDTVDVGHTRSTTYAFLATYGLTDRVTLSGSLPYVETKYWGPPSHGLGASSFPADDGGTHGFLTDLRVNLHYQLLEEPFALAPFIGYVVPTNNNYYVQGHAAQGRGLDEVLVGFGLGKSFDEWIPRTYAQTKYTYAFVEKVAGVSHDRANLSLELGGFLTPRWSLAAYGWWQWTCGGIETPVFPDDPLFPYHDRLANDDYFNVGLGTSWAFTPSITGLAVFAEVKSGNNSHKMYQGVTVGFSYGFRPRAEAVGVAEADRQ